MKTLIAFIAAVVILLSGIAMPASAQGGTAANTALNEKVATLSTQVQQMQQREVASSAEVATLKAQVAQSTQAEKANKPKTTADYAIAFVPSAITVVGTFFVALFATGRIEKQKQRIELYKSLYNERIGAAKSLTRSSGVVVNHLRQHLLGQIGGSKYEGFLEELINHHNSYAWLFSEDVNTRVDNLIVLIESKMPWESKHKQDIEPEILKAEAMLSSINKAITQMMKNDTLERLVGR